MEARAAQGKSGVQLRAFRKKGHSSVIMKSGAETRRPFVLDHWNWSIFPPTKYLANDNFSEPPQRADPVSVLPSFRVTSEARGSVLVGFWGFPSIEPLLGVGSSHGGCIPPPMPRICICLCFN